MQLLIHAYLSISQYLEYFNIDSADSGGGVGTVTAIIFGIVSALKYGTEFSCEALTKIQYSIGSIAGVLVAGPIADRFGRRGGMVN